MRTIIAGIAVCSALFFAGCGSSGPAVRGGENFAHHYGKRSMGLRLAARVHHGTAQRSVVHFKLNTADLLYKSGGQGAPFRAQVQVRCLVYSGWDMRTVLDSAITVVRDQSEQPNENKELIGTLPVPSGTGDRVLLLQARDLNRDVEASLVLPLEAPGGRQDFLPEDADGLPLFDDHVAPGTTVMVRCEQYAGRTLFAEHFSAQRNLPRPIFNDAAPVPRPERDSVSILTVDPNGRVLITMGAAGSVHLRGDTNDVRGYTLYAMDEAYPFVSTPEDLVGPLRYITSNQEWDRIKASNDPRKEVERFWLSAAGDRERAREAIKAYYGRVETANRFFTADTEGWRTDRGLVHIIFGSPNTIRRTPQGELWVYGEETNMLSLMLTFDRRTVPFTDNAVVLRRDAGFKSAWYRNVESWRNGRVLQN